MMNRILKWGVGLGVGALLLLGAGRLEDKLTDGFSLRKISYTHPFNPDWEVVPLNAAEEAKVQGLFGQTFTYFTKGHQTYVFISADGQYVIKFLKCDRVKIKPWLEILPLPAFLEPYRQARIKHKEERLDGVFQGWKVADQLLKEETGVLMVHMNPSTNLHTKLKIVDKLGRREEVDLDQTAFLLQKKVPLFITVLEQAIDAGDQAKAKRLLHHLLSLYLSEYARGIAEPDPFILRNVGVVNEVPIQFDTGRFALIEESKSPTYYIPEMKMKTRRLLVWLKEKDLSLADYFTHLFNELTHGDQAS